MSDTTTQAAATRAEFLINQNMLFPFVDKRLGERDWITPQTIDYIAADKAEASQITMLVQTITPTKFGEMLCVSSEKGLVYTGFQMDGSWDRAMTNVRALFPKADILTSDAGSAIVTNHLTKDSRIALHMFGTDFQHKVWQELLCIPLGCTTTYGDLAARIGDADASRAVGSAVGANPVTLIVPCHRVIHSDGQNKNYLWGVARKAMILALEQSPYSSVNEIERFVA